MKKMTNNDYITKEFLSKELKREFNSFGQEIIGVMKQMHQKYLERFDQIDQRFEGIDKRLDGLDVRLDDIDVRLDGIDVRLDGIDQRLDTLTEEVKHNGQKIDTLISVVNNHDARISKNENLLWVVN